jgi:hypothetical protein
MSSIPINLNKRPLLPTEQDLSDAPQVKIRCLNTPRAKPQNYISPISQINVGQDSGNTSPIPSVTIKCLNVSGRQHSWNIPSIPKSYFEKNPKKEPKPLTLPLLSPGDPSPILEADEKELTIWKAAIRNDTDAVKALVSDKTKLHYRIVGAIIEEAVIHGNKAIYNLFKKFPITANDRGAAIWKGTLKENLDQDTLNILIDLAKGPVPMFYQKQIACASIRNSHQPMIRLCKEKHYSLTSCAPWKFTKTQSETQDILRFFRVCFARHLSVEVEKNKNRNQQKN